MNQVTDNHTSLYLAKYDIEIIKEIKIEFEYI